MKRFLRKFIYLLIITVLVTQPFLVFTNSAKAEEEFIGHEEGGLYNDEEESVGGVVISDPIAVAATSLLVVDSDTSDTLSTHVSDGSRASLSNLEKYKSRLLFKPSDQQDIRILYCLGKAIPDYANHDEVLAEATGKSVSEIENLRLEKPDDWGKLVIQMQEAARADIVSRLRFDLPNFACIAGVDETMAADMLAHDEESVSAVIANAEEKVIIDRRILMLLANLVTPKNQNGAGHERIRIHRIRSGYDRDARMYSRESDAIREEIARDQEAAASTVNDVSTATSEDLAENPEFQNAEAQAAVMDSAGNSQGDLIFSDTEDDINMSAHSRGQAIDISEIDNVKCTMIKKKRLGRDKKIPQPLTPIKVGWQTSSGYDSSPPPDYSSMAMNLQQIASGQYLDMLDELGVDVDDEEDLSDASFGDIIGLIGESMLAEILSSPNTSLSGFSLSDTAKKIGGMILADKLGLPRAPFVEADLGNLHDLEIKIGEAVLEKNLQLNYGSIRGENLAQILENVGLRHVEKQLGVPAETITAGLSGPELQITIGRRIIEEKLRLEAGTFKADTNYNRLGEIAGERKVSYLFTNPTEIDELLGLDINEGYSAKYKNGDSSMTPDRYSTLVGAKVLADRAYIFAYGTSAGTALYLDPEQSLGSFNLDTAGNRSVLSNTATQSRARFNWIMSGNLSNQPGVTTPGSFNEIYQSLGVDILASSLSVNSETRTAIASWLNTNKLPSQTICTTGNTITITIAKPGSTTGETINITIPEDQIMTTFGLRRGDLERLFGCYDVAVEGVFRGLGEKALYDAIRNSSSVEQARARFLADHPEVTSFLSDVEFYRSRISEIKRLIDKIKNDWRDTGSSNEAARTAIAQINSSIGSIESEVGSINTDSISLSNISQTVSQIRRIPSVVDRILSATTDIEQASEELRTRANTTLIDVNGLIHNVDEILSGQDQPEIASLQIGELNTSGSSSAGNNSSSGNSINRASLILMLSGRLSPKDFMISTGSNMIEDSLNLPTNSVLYYAKHLENPNRNKDDGKNTFFRAIGQAQIEETLSMPPYFFQGEYSASEATLTDVKNHVAEEYDLTESEAGARIMQALRLPGDFSVIENRSISNISNIVTAADSLDSQIGLTKGTTKSFLNGSAIDTVDLGNSEVRMLAGQFKVSEEVIRTFTRVRNGIQPLADARQNTYATTIAYNNHNEYAERPGLGTGNAVDQCPIRFGYDLTTQTFSTGFIEDNSYVYSNETETRSFPSLAEARNYQETVPATQRTDFVRTLGSAMATSDEQSTRFTQQLENFLNNPDQAYAFSDEDIEFLSREYSIPIETLHDAFQREDLIGQGADKPIHFYLEQVGKKVAERRISSALLGSFSATFAGLRIDATDIYDILDGNGLQVAYRIGSRFLEEELGITTGLISQIIEAGNINLRNCSLANIGGGILGSALGVGRVTLTGNIYENIGGAKIEKALGLPDMSFRGANINQLISSIGPTKFAQIFGLPIDRIAPPALRNQALGANHSGYVETLPIDDQMAEIDNIFTMPQMMGNYNELPTVESQIEANIRQFVHDPNIWNIIDPGSNDENYQLRKFQQRISQIDSLTGVSTGMTKELILGTKTPDQYKQAAAGNVLLTNAEGILNVLGLGEYAEFVVRGISLANMVGNTLRDLRNCQNTATCASVRVSIFQNIQSLFGVNFDAKLGLPDGTIAAIITDPQQAAFRLASGALTRLDSSLGLVDDNGRPLNNASFTAAFQVWWNTDYKNCADTPETCMTNNQEDIVPINIYDQENRYEYIAINAAEHIASTWLGAGTNGLGIRNQQAPTDGSYYGAPRSNNLIHESIEMLIHGDLRILEVVAAVQGLQALHLYNDSDQPNLPLQFRVTYEDVYYAFMGDPIGEQARVEAADNNFFANYQTESETLPANLAEPSEGSEMAGAPSVPYGSQCPTGTTSATCVDPENPAAFTYDTYQNFGTMTADFQQEYPSNLSQDELLEVHQEVSSSPSAREDLARVEENARNDYRRELRNNLMWRMADAQLYQLDPNIPAGFARTMFSGNGVDRTSALLSYLENAVRNSAESISIGGVTIGELGQAYALIQEARTFFADPSSYNLDALVADGRMASLDNWLSSKFSDFMGFDLQPGTFTAIFYGLKKGDFSFADFTVGGQPIQSLKTIYTDWAIGKITGWADKALGLPPGTVLTAYKMYKGIVAARTNLAIASKIAGKTGNTTMLANAKARVTALKAELISFIITTIFAKQIGQMETSLGLVPGTGALLVSMAVSYLLGAAINPLLIAAFVLMNLLGVYKVEVWCTADGYYPSIRTPSDTNPLGSGDPNIYDNGGLGTFDGQNNNAKKEGFIEAARYKVRTVIGDALMLAERTGDPTAIPSQIMTGRQEDVDYWKYKTDTQICDSMGGCEGTRAGIWVNPQTTGYIHIGF